MDKRDPEDDLSTLASAPSGPVADARWRLRLVHYIRDNPQQGPEEILLGLGARGADFRRVTQGPGGLVSEGLVEYAFNPPGWISPLSLVPSVGGTLTVDSLGHNYGAAAIEKAVDAYNRLARSAYEESTTTMLPEAPVIESPQPGLGGGAAPSSSGVRPSSSGDSDPTRGLRPPLDRREGVKDHPEEPPMSSNEPALPPPVGDPQDTWVWVDLGATGNLPERIQAQVAVLNQSAAVEELGVHVNRSTVARRALVLGLRLMESAEASAHPSASQVQATPPPKPPPAAAPRRELRQVPFQADDLISDDDPPDSPFGEGEDWDVPDDDGPPESPPAVVERPTMGNVLRTYNTTRFHEGSPGTLSPRSAEAADRYHEAGWVFIWYVDGMNKTPTFWGQGIPAGAAERMPFYVSGTQGVVTPDGEWLHFLPANFCAQP
jgi:hypothetical protein